MVKKVNLSEAAAEILAASVASKRGSGEKFVANKGAKFEDEQGKQDLGGPVVHGDSDLSIGKNAASKIGKATPPGATPPVGSDPSGVGAKKISGPQDHEGRSDLTSHAEPVDQDESGRVARKGAKSTVQTFAANKGALKPYVPEEKDEKGKDVEDDDEDEDDDKDDDEKKESKKKKMKEKMKEDIDALLSGENLSEEFVQKATTIFEAAVLERVEAITEELVSEMEEQIQEQIEEITNTLSEDVNKYLDYVVEQYLEHNQLAIEQGLRAEIAEDFMTGLHKLFTENFINIPDEKVDVVEELSAKVEELASKLDESIDYNVSLKEQIKEFKKSETVHAVCEGLTQTQVEKIMALAENVEFTTEEEFAEKMETIRESYFPSNVKTANASDLVEGVDLEEEKVVKKSADPIMEQYTKAISKQRLI